MSLSEVGHVLISPQKSGNKGGVEINCCLFPVYSLRDYSHIMYLQRTLHVSRQDLLAFTKNKDNSILTPVHVLYQ